MSVPLCQHNPSLTPIFSLCKHGSILCACLATTEQSHSHYIHHLIELPMLNNAQLHSALHDGFQITQYPDCVLHVGH